MYSLLEKWLKYVELEALMQTRLDLSQLNELQFLPFDKEKKVDGGNVFFTVSEQAQTFIQSKLFEKDASASKKIVLSYPYVLVKHKGKEYVRPLFIFDISVDKKIGSNISVNVFGDTGYAPVAEFFEQDFKIDREIFVENISFYRQINKFLEQDDGDFFESMDKFCELLNSLKTNNGIIEIKYDTALIHDVESGFLAKKMRDSIRVLEHVNTSSSLLDVYASKKSDGIFDPSIYDEHFYYGKFETKTPVSLGQHRAIKAIHSGEKIVAVQGGPGTGKTTLFKSVISSVIVKRALSIIKGRDYNNQMVVVSVANKAIENIIDGFKEHPYFSDCNDFYFSTGSTEQTNISLDRMQKYLDELEFRKFNQERYSELSSRISELVSDIDKRRQKYQQLRTLYEHGIKQEEQHSKNVAAWPKAQSELKNIFNDDLNTVKERFLAGQAFFKDLSVYEKEYCNNSCSDRHWKNLDSLYARAKDVNSRLRNIPWFMFEPITGKKQKILKNFYDSCGDILSAFNIKEVYESSEFESGIVEKLYHISFFYNDLKKRHDVHPFFLDSFDNLGYVDKLLKAEAPWRESRKFLNQFASIKNEFSNSYANKSDFERFSFVKEQEELFLLSIEFLRLEQAKRKPFVKNALNNMRNLITGNQSRRTSKMIYEAGVVNFFKEFSLVFPVISTTMASSWNLTKDFVYSFETQDGNEKVMDYISGYKPFHLVLSDESGMTKLHEPASLLYAAESTLVVGDTKQLPPIFNIAPNVAENFEIENFRDISDAEIYSPTMASFYHRAAGCRTSSFEDIGDSLVLDEHRRCQPKIASLFMEIGNYTGIEIKTPPLSPEEELKLDLFSVGENLVYFNVDGETAGYRHTNIKEVETIGKVLDQLFDAGFDLTKNVGIITPYVAQKELLIQKYGERLGHTKNTQRIGTIHAFQGAEYDVVIFSSVIFDNKDSGSFLNSSPNILNVAISRARMLFITVCNRDKLINSGGNLLKIISRSEEKTI